MNRFEKTHEELKRQLASLGIYDSDEQKGKDFTEKNIEISSDLAETFLEKDTAEVLKEDSKTV